uniref:Retrotransposon protein, putative, unclassified n=1 Tax=Oryza sativa subsp. japonica TaxID=39947 RepID=Q33BG9_ORYSJ|nr:retrotransposon protein, putative, unclassified [Oryza sativa Japonica Group]
MAEKPPPSPSSASPGSVKEKIQQLDLSEVNEGNVMTITLDKLTPDQKEFEAMMQQARNQFLNSFMQTRKGTVVQKYQVRVVADVPGTGSSKDGEMKQALGGSAQPSNKGATNGSAQENQGDHSQGVHGVQGDGTQGPRGGSLNQDGSASQEFFNNFQDRVDYAVHNAFINQSGVLVNTLSNMMKSIADGSIAKHQAAGPVYLPGGQLVNPRQLMRENPQHSGQVANRLTQDQVATMFLPLQPTVDLVQQQPIQQTPPIQQVVQPIQQQVVQSVEQTPPRQQIVHPIQQTPSRQQTIQPIHQQGLMNPSAGQHTLNQVVPEHLVHHVQLDHTVVPQIVPEHLGMIAPIREKFSSEDFESLPHLTQKVTLHEQRFAEARRNSRKVNHVCSYMCGSDDEDDDSEIAAAEWVRSKKVMPCQWVKNSGKEERYDFDITKADKIFDLLLWEMQIQLPAGHTIPSAEELGKKRYCKWHNSGSHTTNDGKVFRQQIQSAIEGGKIKFDDSKKPMKVDGNPFPVNMVHTAGQTADGGRARGFQMNSAKIINKYQRKYNKQQEKHYEEGDDGFDPHWGCEFFRFCWNEGMRLPYIEDYPGCGNVAESSSRSYIKGNRLKHARVPVHQRLGPVNQDHDPEDDENRKTQWCPPGIFTKNQKRRVQRLRN